MRLLPWASLFFIACATTGDTWNATAHPAPVPIERPQRMSGLGIAATTTGIGSALHLGLGGLAWDQSDRQTNGLAGYFIRVLSIQQFTIGAALGIISIGLAGGSARQKQERRLTSRR